MGNFQVKFPSSSNSGAMRDLATALSKTNSEAPAVSNSGIFMRLFQRFFPGKMGSQHDRAVEYTQKDNERNSGDIECIMEELRELRQDFSDFPSAQVPHSRL